MLNIEFHRIAVLDFNSIFNKHIETDLINDLEKFGLINDSSINIKQKDVKKFFYHHIIHGMSNYFLNTKTKNKPIIFYTKLAPVGKQILELCQTEDLQDFLNKTVVKISKLLPLRWFFSDCTFDTLKRVVKKGEGDGHDLINRIRCEMDKHDPSKFTYTKARTFAARYELNFLTNNFFKKIYSKQLILS